MPSPIHSLLSLVRQLRITADHTHWHREICRELLQFCSENALTFIKIWDQAVPMLCPSLQHLGPGKLAACVLILLSYRVCNCIAYSSPVECRPLCLTWARALYELYSYYVISGTDVLQNAAIHPMNGTGAPFFSPCSKFCTFLKFILEMDSFTRMQRSTPGSGLGRVQGLQGQKLLTWAPHLPTVAGFVLTWWPALVKTYCPAKRFFHSLTQQFTAWAAFTIVTFSLALNLLLPQPFTAIHSFLPIDRFAGICPFSNTLLHRSMRERDSMIFTYSSFLFYRVILIKKTFFRIKHLWSSLDMHISGLQSHSALSSLEQEESQSPGYP